MRSIVTELLPNGSQAHLARTPGLQDHLEGERMAPAAVRKRLHLTLLFCCQWKREQDFDLQLLDRAVHGERKDKENGWLKVQAMPVTELDLEPQDYDLDISREVRAGSSFVLPQEAWPSGSQPDPPSQRHWGLLSSMGTRLSFNVAQETGWIAA